MARVTDIGGVFFRSRDPQALGAWYERHLGVPYREGFASFRGANDSDPEARTLWVPFDNDTAHFGSTTQPFMVNFRVDDLDALLAQLAENAVEIVPERSDDAFGRFAWIVDCEGNRVELWQPPGDASDRVGS